MKRRFIVLGLLVSMAFANSTAFAATGTQNIPVTYNNIKIVVDGNTLSTSAEPFIYNGTTYLPVRAVGEAVGKEVTWDGNSNTVYLGEIPKNSEPVADVEQEITVDKNIESVEILMPASFFGDSSEQEIIASARADGIEATANGDGSYTYKMSKSKYNEMINAFKISFDDSLKDISESGDYPSIKLVEADANYKNFKLYVDKGAYESSLDSIAEINIYIEALFYHALNGENVDNLQLNFTIIDNLTKEAFLTEVYPIEETN
jgi:hypothetical protein